MIAENVAKQSGGSYMTKRYIDIIDSKPQKEIDSQKIISDLESKGIKFKREEVD